eukprot:NODE_65_length_25825_cov_1.353844.p20 type:complete len:138 gc:universal NODE_65_length_25825_cov_1.353844:6126-6539(+)
MRVISVVVPQNKRQSNEPASESKKPKVCDENIKENVATATKEEKIEPQVEVENKEEEASDLNDESKSESPQEDEEQEVLLTQVEKNSEVPKFEVKDTITKEVEVGAAENQVNEEVSVPEIKIVESLEAEAEEKTVAK